MKAIVQEKYGPPDRLTLREIDRPPVADDGVLVRVQAASVNPADFHMIRGEPFPARLMMGGRRALRRPTHPVPGTDVSGIVDAVGARVTEFQPGDEVFGARTGAFAEHVSGAERNFVPKPARVTFEQAAALPVAGITALQGLRDKGGLQPGQRVLINGAAGGVGSFAVQIAKAFGAEVTGVCSAGNVDLVRSIGADHVVDYTTEDFTRDGNAYDLILDNVGNRPLSALRRVLTPNGTLILNGGGIGLPRLAARMLSAVVLTKVGSQRLTSFLAQLRKEDLVVLKELVEGGKVTPVVDRRYPLAETPEALRYLEAGHARGKVVIDVGS